ncbi:MAG TPA: AarF/UbiB family protein [Gaiellaceae bacterium]|jgi:predicted unusual protein kinase regulating ubiquinone biosynthesis (AarF/ABC1/UbiB family)|nr:AarF/UbiB family protein [Gaiellaceae bacterium]
MAGRAGRARRALEVTRVARRGRLLRVLREVGAVGSGRPATPEGARAFRLSLEELGTTYVKLGQLLSSRPDLLPDEYIRELSRLVDDVPPVSFDAIRTVIDEEIGLDAFSRIDEEPLASASIGQIHTALLRSGRSVVVKVQRPGIAEEVAVDLDLLRSLTSMAEGRSETARLLQLEALADDLEAHLTTELDFVEEAHGSEVIAGLISDFEHLTVPQVVHPYVTTRVLVQERMHGQKVTEAHGLEPELAQRLARELFRAYVQQITVHGVYHADPHRGNVLLADDGRLVLLDFGLLGRIDDDTRRTLGLLLLALAQNRAEDVADLILGLSLTSLRSDEAGFVHELRRKLPRYHWRPLSGVRTGEALADLQRIALRHGIRLPTSFALVGKTLAQADSVARALDPRLDPIELLEEDGMTVMLQEAERRLEPKQLLALGYTQFEPLLRMPRRLSQLVSRVEEGTVRFGIVPQELDELEHVVRSFANRLGAAIIIAALLIASALMARVNEGVALVGFLLSVALGLYELWKIFRTPGDL